MATDLGAFPASGSGSRPTDRASDAVSPVPASIPNAYGEPISTVAELDTMDPDEIVEGYRDGRAGEPEPMGNRSRGYWHGWRNGMADAGRHPIDAAMRALARDVLARQSKRTGA